MFWNDPIFYGASFPYRELTPPTQLPFQGSTFLPWSNLPKFAPPTYGFYPPTYNLPQVWNAPQMGTPYAHWNAPQMGTPYAPWNAPQVGLPYAHMNQPFFGGYKPFTF